MKPLKHLSLLVVITALLLPFSSSAATSEAKAGLACTTESALGFGNGVFKSLSKKRASIYSELYKNAEKKRRLSKAHRKALLKRAKKSKFL